MLGHKRPWLPGFILRQTVSISKFKRLIDIAEPEAPEAGELVQAAHDPALRPHRRPDGRALRLPGRRVGADPFPGTNFPPSIALVIASIAVMEEDGYLLILGYLIGFARVRLYGDGARGLLPPHSGRHSQRAGLARVLTGRVSARALGPPGPSPPYKPAIVNFLGLTGACDPSRSRPHIRRPRWPDIHSSRISCTARARWTRCAPRCSPSSPAKSPWRPRWACPIPT